MDPILSTGIKIDKNIAGALDIYAYGKIIFSLFT